MEELLRRIRRRCLIVGAASVAALFAELGLLMTDSLPERMPFWLGPAGAVCCTAGLAVLALSGRQLRQARTDRGDGAGLLKKAEVNCWGAVGCIVLALGWIAAGALFFRGGRIGGPIGACHGIVLYDSLTAASALGKALRARADAGAIE